MLICTPRWSVVHGVEAILRHRMVDNPNAPCGCWVLCPPKVCQPQGRSSHCCPVHCPRDRTQQIGTVDCRIGGIFVAVSGKQCCESGVVRHVRPVCAADQLSGKCCGLPPPAHPPSGCQWNLLEEPSVVALPHSHQNEGFYTALWSVSLWGGARIICKSTPKPCSENPTNQFLVKGYGALPTAPATRMTRTENRGGTPLQENDRDTTGHHRVKWQERGLSVDRPDDGPRSSPGKADQNAAR